MNPSNLIARSVRNVGTEKPSSAVHGEIDQNLEVAAESDFLPDADPQRMAEDIRLLRLALAQMLSRETGQDIQIFRGPVVDNQRLCRIADNLWNHRRWSAA